MFEILKAKLKKSGVGKLAHKITDKFHKWVNKSKLESGNSMLISET